MGRSAKEYRAEIRRRTWTGGIAHGFAEAEEMDLEFWLSATASQRIAAVTQLIRGLPWPEEGTERGSADRLQRTIGGVRPRSG